MARMYSRFIFIAALCLPWAAKAELRLEYNVVHSLSELNAGSMFNLPDAYRQIDTDRQQHEMQVAYNEEDLRMVIAANTSRSDVAGTAFSEVAVQEAVYDFSLHGYEWSIGRKIVAWGVGYGFRPLDIIQQETRLQWQTLSMQGRFILSMEHFGSDSADSWVLYQDRRANPLDVVDAAALAYQHYRLLENSDLYGIASLNEHGRYKIGAGYSQVVNEKTEWHGSVLYLSDYDKFIRSDSAALIASSEPFQSRSYKDGLRLLLGSSRSFRSGLNLMFEAWYDASAYSNMEWQHLIAISTQQLALLGGSTPIDAIYGNLGWNSRAFQASSLMQQNMMLRLGYDGERLEPSGYLLYAPEDGGIIANLSLSTELGESTKISISWQQFGGHADSVYAQMPMKQMLALGFSIAGLW